MVVKVGLEPTIPPFNTDEASQLTYSTITPLLYHNLGGLSRGFSNFFSERPLWDLNPSARSPAFNLVGTLPLTSLVYHTPPQKSTGNVAQLWEIVRAEVCAICLLTKSAGCGIMEILLATTRGEQLKSHPFLGVAFCRVLHTPVNIYEQGVLLGGCGHLVASFHKSLHCVIPSFAITHYH